MIPNIEKLEVKVEESGERLDKIIASHVRDISRSRIQKLIKDNLVTINEKIVTDRSYQVKAGDSILITLKPSESEGVIVAKEIPFEIVFEDEDLMVINKPAGLTVHPGAGNHQDTLVNALMFHTKGKLAGDSQRPGIVHRLDKDTSGLMLIAKSEFAHFKLTQAIANREVTRIYVAFILGTLMPAFGTIKTSYGRSKVDRKKMTVKHHGEKMAITHYQVLRVFKNSISEVECKLDTGRTHQIRVHLDHKKVPIIGDQTYGKSKNHNLAAFSEDEMTFIKNFPRQALHSKQIGFVHPRTEEYLQFESDLPRDMLKLLEVISHN